MASAEWDSSGSVVYHTVSPEVERGAARAFRLATELFPGAVAPPQPVPDPEAPAEWRMTVTIRCRGTVAGAIRRYSELVERFVYEISPHIRDRLRFEVIVED